MINDEKQIIFIHIPKNAGTSIEHALMSSKESIDMDTNKLEYIKWKIEKYDPLKLHRHSKYPDYINYEPEKWKTYTKFAVIRNPYDRIVSWYNYLKKLCEQYEELWLNAQLNAKHGQLHKIMNEKPPRFNYTFKQFVYNHYKIAELVSIAIGQPWNYRELFDPQFYWVDDSVEILKYENLKEDFNKLLPNIKLPLKNKSIRSKESFVEYYTRETADKIYNEYTEDFKKYNYEKL